MKVMMLLAALLPNLAFAAPLLHVSYDPTREFYEAYNAEFKKTHPEVSIRQSHGGSGKQARAVIDGLNADIVSLALAYDIDAIAEKSALLPKDWANAFPNHSVPMHSVIVLLVRKGNPKAIKDWDDLTKEGVEVITPNPKTSGGARWNYLAAYAYGLKMNANDKAKAAAFVGEIYKHVKVLDTGARGSTMTFVQRNIGDVLITWENEAYLAKEQLGAGKFEIVYPSLTIKADTPVAVVTKNASAKGNEQLAKAYVAGLFERPAQLLAAKHYFRPQDADVAAKFKHLFPEAPSVSIDALGGWQAVQTEHFADGGVFDSIYGKAQ
jgi:sulfate/thiosulfate transport system substrate-binding protein